MILFMVKVEANEIGKKTEEVATSTLTDEASQMFEKYKGGTFCCGGTINDDNIKAYLHDGGVSLQDGTKIWLYAECDECGYGLSFQYWDNKVYF